MKLTKSKNSIKFFLTIILSTFVIAVLSFVSFASTQIAVAKTNEAVPTISNTVTKGEPGVMTVDNEIKTGLMPVGHCLYIFGGS